jgi:hypothetical protein
MNEAQRAAHLLQAEDWRENNRNERRAMHECPHCGFGCDCDGEDTWYEWPFNENCQHECEEEENEE